MATSWYTFVEVLSSWRYLRNKIASFEIFQKIPKTPTLWGKLRALKCIPEISISFYLVAFFVGYVVVYSDFSVGAVFVEQFAKQNCQFSAFLPNIGWGHYLVRTNFWKKFWKQTILFCKLLLKNGTYRKIGVNHNIANETIRQDRN